VTYTEWIFFGLMAIGLIGIRRRRDVRRAYAMPGSPVLPLLFAVMAFAVVLHLVLANPRETLSGLGLVLLGLPVYYLGARQGLVPKAAP
jgi:APA family basic amino acid/polyamine antiporter